MKYRKLPVEIEAIKWGPTSFTDGMPDWLIDAYNRGAIMFESDPRNGDTCLLPVIETLEGTMKARLGDYIIKGINGEIYPCKPDIFEKTYEAVTSVQNVIMHTIMNIPGGLRDALNQKG